uniref:Uncharacterized protein n=1 Tax=viral metagenome TaxID=1070528 RepID=A0A6C0LTG1_9ZZZZ
MIHRLLCFLIFTTNLKPNYKELQSPYITPTDNILTKVHTMYFNEYFHSIIEEEHEKIVMVSAVAYDACNKYAGKKNNQTSEFFKHTMDNVETYLSKMISSKHDTTNITTTYEPPLYNIVEFYKGSSIPNELTVFKSYNFDKCMVYNYNYDKCNIVV